jgi:serine phosphatase RsbU (regulator of sigma subunit)
VTIRDPNDRILYANGAALRHLGFDTLEELQATSLHSIMDQYLVFDEHGRELTMNDVPSVRVLRGQAAEPLLMNTINQVTGEARWERLKTAALRDADGQLAAAVTIIEDLTAVKTAEVHTRILANSGRILASTLDYEQTLRNVAQAAVPDLADWCIVELLDERGRREPVVVTHRIAEKQELVRALQAFEPEQLDPHSAAGRVFHSGKPELFFDIPDEQLVQTARSEEHLRLMRQLSLRSAAVVPMRVPTRTIGVMTFLMAESRRRLTPDDLDLAEQLGRRAAVAVENSRLHTTLADVAHTLQKSLLPHALPDIPGWEIAALYRPAGAEQRIEVGGDFYEVFNAESSSFALIGDVTGHGVTAATLTSMMRYGARFASRLEPQPSAILRRLDEELRQRSDPELCTALCARIQDRAMIVASAGHPPALIVDTDGVVTEAPEPGPLLGAFEDSHWEQSTLSVGPDQLVLLYTDGVTETAGANERFGAERLRRLLSEHARQAPSELLRSLDEALVEFRGGAASDDVAALAFRPRH